MAWGYEACFTVEHDDTLKRKIDCKDCIYYDASDKSCMRTPRYLPEDGYNSWRKCGQFELDPTVCHYDEKKEQFKKWSVQMAKRETAEHKKKFSKKANNKARSVKKATKKSVMPKEKTTINRITDTECKNLILKEYVNKSEIPNGATTKILYIYLDDGKKESIQLAVISGFAFVNSNSYPSEYMMETKRIFKKRTSVVS